MARWPPLSSRNPGRSNTKAPSTATPIAGVFEEVMLKVTEKGLK